ncbi:MAG TPA: DUF5666 domain-containing protein [bacterium]|nr:DUF5666 domain-containing protein [bacterium]
MRQHLRPGRLISAIVAVVAWGAAMPTSAASAGPATMVEGTIVAVNGSGLRLAPAGGGERVVEVGPDSLILARQAATLGEITPGAALGIAAKREADGSLSATSINIFSPELWNRVTKGQFPMRSGDVMTNAVVMQYADRVEGHTLYMKYNDGSAAINVPAATEIHRLVTLRLGDLKPGMRISVRGTGNTDGSIRASTIVFNRPGQA